MLTLAILVDRSYPLEAVEAATFLLICALFVGFSFAVIWTWKRSPIGGKALLGATLFAIGLSIIKATTWFVAIRMYGSAFFEVRELLFTTEALLVVGYAAALFMMLSTLVRCRDLIGVAAGRCPHCQAKLGEQDAQQCPDCGKTFTIVIRYEVQRRREGVR